MPRVNNNGYSNDVNSLLEQETATRIREYKKQLSEKLKGMEDEALKQKEINRELDRYTAKQYEQLNLKKQQIQAQVSEYQYQKASLSDKLKITNAEKESLETKLQEARAYEEISRGTSSNATAQQLINNLEERRAVLLDRQIKLQSAINAGSSVNATLAQKIAYSEQKRAEYKKQIAQAENDYKIAMQYAENPYEAGQAKHAYNQRLKEINSNAGFLDKIFSAFDKISSKLDVLHKDMSVTVKDAMDVMANTMYRIDTRLYESDYDFSKIISYAYKDGNLAANPLVSAKKYIDSVVSLTENGIASNLETRALLATVSDRLVATFDSLDSTLTRFIRLQNNSDSFELTKAKVGVEAGLNELLNSKFKDTSYLNSLYDSIESALIDSASMMTAENATAYEYAVQKWLGALYAVGMSESAIQSIAEGLNYLGTGNVSALNGNSSLQTLMAMSASRAGVSYADILNNGADVGNINKLMKSMIEYLKDIANNTGNNVTKSAFGDIYNLTQSDLRAIQNLTTEQITNLYNENLDYYTAIGKYNEQLDKVSDRTAASEMVNNVIDNVMFNLGVSALGIDDPNKDKSDAIWRYLMYNAEDIAETLEPVIGSTVSNIISSLGRAGAQFITFGSTIDAVKNIFGSILSGGWGTLDNMKSEITLNGSYPSVDTASAANSSLGTLLNGFIKKGISVSGGISNLANKAMQGYSLEYATMTDTLKTASSATVVGYDEAAVERTVSDIYAQLFDNKRTIRVDVANIEEKAKEDLRLTFSKEEFMEMFTLMYETLVEGEVKVDVIDSDVNKIINTTYKVREM